jgi:integrase/recombinase XerD
MLNERPKRETTHLSDWDAGTKYANAYLISGTRPTSNQTQASAKRLTLEEALDQFLLRKGLGQRLQESTLYKYRHLKSELLAFSKLQNLIFLEDLSLDLLDRFQARWDQADITCFKKLERLKAFCRFCVTRGWISNNPALGLLPPKVQPKQTQPFSREDMQEIIAATYRYRDKSKRLGQDNAQRLLAFILLLRYSGLRIGDAVSCRIDQLQGTKLYLYTQKTGQPIYCPLPTEVVQRLRLLPRLGEKHFFWTGCSKLHTAVGTWQRTLKRLFTMAGIDGGHAHRFRDTFAVETLLHGGSIEEVAVLLGHSNIKVTQKHYNPWIPARQRQLEASVERTWQSDPILRKSGTQTVRREELQESNLFIIGGKEMVPAGGIEPTA